MEITWIGIDPGLHGAIARLSTTESIWDTPTLQVKSPKGTRAEYQIARMSEILDQCTVGTHTISAIVESVTAMPRQGVVSMFRMGRGLGIWEALLVSHQIPYTLVRPTQWKKVMLSGMDTSKEASRLRAQQLFPTAELHLKKHEGRAEALLLAAYGRTRVMESCEDCGLPGVALCERCERNRAHEALHEQGD